MTGQTPPGAGCSPTQRRADQTRPTPTTPSHPTAVVSQNGMTITVTDLNGRALSITPLITSDRIDIGVGNHFFSIRYALYVADVIQGMANAVNRPGIPHD